MSLDNERKRLFEEESSEPSTRSNKRLRLEQSEGKALMLPPLEGVVACLTGFGTEEKIHLHSLIEGLGGTYSRDFNLDKNTHLIAVAAEGAKYEAACRHPQMHIVTPAWLEACREARLRVKEQKYAIDKSSTHNKATLLERLRSLLQAPRDSVTSLLFQDECFYLLGFEQQPELKHSLSKLIRRGRGTIFWELTESTSRVILNDGCSEILCKAAQVVSTHHCNLPSAVSIRWILDSWKQQALLPTSAYAPISSKAPPVLKQPPPHRVARSQSSSSSLFRGHVFCLMRISPPIWAVDFNTRQLETLVQSQGGQILTPHLVEAMKKDVSKATLRRKCFVVSWGGKPQMQLNPILSQVRKHNLCGVILVSPIWLRVCSSAQRVVDAQRLPVAMIPQGWPIRKSLSPETRVALTGFQGTQKLAIVHLIQAMGGVFHDNMTKATTHLVCSSKATGVKREKAIEWGLHIVSVSWLEHIAEFGYGGKGKSKGGCTSLFDVRDAK